MSVVDFTRLSPAQLADEFNAIAQDAARVFRGYDATQLNWRPDEARWSVAQCFDHLVRSEAEMSGAMARALDPSVPRTLWQRLPLWPRLFGRLLITSLGPTVTRRFTAPTAARPTASDIPSHVIDRFIDCQTSLAARVTALTALEAERVMVSPFLSHVTYSVLDGYRIIATHQRRHVEQARRVTETPGFPPLA